MEKRTYEEAVAYIEELRHFGSRPGLERINRLLEAVGSPHEGMNFVHVAGTKGKGSVASMTAAALSAQGYKTGLYLSPSVYDFKEKIQVDGAFEEGLFLSAFETAAAAAKKMERDGHEHPTEYELINTIAFLCFKSAGCDIAVLEAGLGGRLDTTNAIGAPLAAVITSVSFDHMDVLGDTLEKIAFEKSAIIKPGSAAVLYMPQREGVEAVVRRRCGEAGAPLTCVEESELHVETVAFEMTELTYKGERYFLKPAGRHFAKDAAAAIETLNVLSQGGFPVEGENVKKALAKTALPGRMELLCTAPYIILDGAHNEDSVAKLCETLDEAAAGRRIITVMGMFADKEYKKCIPPIAARSEVFLATQPQGSRALDAATVWRHGKDLAAFAGIVQRPESAALVASRFVKSDGDVILFCGSFSFLGEAKAHFERLLQLRTGYNKF